MKIKNQKFKMKENKRNNANCPSSDHCCINHIGNSEY